MAIARNYRRFPEALLYQLELTLGDVRDTFEWIRVNRPTVWGVIARQFQDAKAGVRNKVPTPEWVLVARRKAKALADAVRKACRVLCFSVPLRDWTATMQMDMVF